MSPEVEQLERIAFELWNRQYWGRQSAPPRTSKGQYAHSYTEAQWQAWRMRAQLVTVTQSAIEEARKGGEA